MESYEKESMRRIRRNSKNLLQGLFYRGIHTADSDCPIPASPGRDAKMIHSIGSLIRRKSKLLLLESPNTIEVYKLDKHSGKAGTDQVYLPAITTKASNLNSMSGALSQSCPYLYSKRRGSVSSLGSQKTWDYSRKPSKFKAQREAKKSNVTVTMTYLGQGRPGSGLGSLQDELKVLQQVSGGENICVFKGFVTPGERFQFVSQRHRGYPFSATMYVNGIMAARISSCCEYRYGPGFQQGRKSCFRLSWLAGGLPCYRCTSLRNKYSSCQQLNNGTKETRILPPDQNSGTVESSPSSPLFLPAKPDSKSVRKTREQHKDASIRSTDSEDLAVGVVKCNSKPKRRKGQSNPKEGKSRIAESNRGTKNETEGRDRTLTGAEDGEGQRHGQGPTLPAERDRVKLKTSSKARTPQADHREFSKTCKVPVLQRRRLNKRMSSCPKAAGSDVELSEESDSALPPTDVSRDQVQDESVQEQDLQAQLDAMITVLNTSDEVDQLVLRNTDLTDDLLLNVAGALKGSRSEVTLLNLNLNCIGPYGAHILLDLLRAKPQVKGIHLFGNKLRDHGVQALLTGIAELQEQTARNAALQQMMVIPSDQNMLMQLAGTNFPATWGSVKVFALVELDIGGNGLSSDGLKVLAAYMQHHSCLQYLGLAQTRGADLVAWRELFNSLKGNNSLTQIILDESNLGDPGVRMLAEVLKVNVSLRQVDLDRNGISDVGGNDIMGALLCRAQFPLSHLSLRENNISARLMRRIKEEVKCQQL